MGAGLNVRKLYMCCLAKIQGSLEYLKGARGDEEIQTATKDLNERFAALRRAYDDCGSVALQTRAFEEAPQPSGIGH